MKALRSHKSRVQNAIVKKLLIRPVRSDEIAVLLRLCREHAVYEKSDFLPAGKSEHLRCAIFAAPPRLWCFVAVADGVIAGYATCTKDFSTWHAEEYLHLDCIYLVPKYRGLGIGTKMMQAIARHAASLGCASMEWQTPAWNKNAIQFYRRLGSIAREKVRFRWDYALRLPEGGGEHAP